MKRNQNNSKIIRFKKNISKEYDSKIEKLIYNQENIRIYNNQKPYMAIEFNDKLVSCLWLENEMFEREFSVITDKEYRNMGFAKILLSEMINDVITKKIKEDVYCIPLNKYIRKTIKKIGFEREFSNSEFWFY